MGNAMQVSCTQLRDNLSAVEDLRDRARDAAEDARQRLLRARERLKEAENVLDRITLGAGAIAGGAPGPMRAPAEQVPAVPNEVHDGLQELARQSDEVERRRQDVVFAETDLAGRKSDLAFQESQVMRWLADLRTAGC